MLSHPPLSAITALLSCSLAQCRAVCPQPGSAAKGSFLLRDAIIGFETPVLKPTKADSEGRFGLRVTPAPSGRHYMLRASSEEERRV